jgi:hypothetical protein
MPGSSRTVSTAPAIDPGKALGASTRGNLTPSGEDRHPPQPTADAFKADESGFIPGDPNAPGGQLSEEEEDPDKQREHNDEDTVGGHIGGSGAMARKFSNPDSASIYDNYAKQMGGGPTPARVFSGRAAGTAGSSMLKKAPPRDNGAESEGGEDY